MKNILIFNLFILSMVNIWAQKTITIDENLFLVMKNVDSSIYAECSRKNASFILENKFVHINEYVTNANGKSDIIKDSHKIKLKEMVAIFDKFNTALNENNHPEKKRLILEIFNKNLDHFLMVETLLNLALDRNDLRVLGIYFSMLNTDRSNSRFSYNIAKQMLIKFSKLLENKKPIESIYILKYINYISNNPIIIDRVELKYLIKAQQLLNKMKPICFTFKYDSFLNCVISLKNGVDKEAYFKNNILKKEKMNIGDILSLNYMGINDYKFREIAIKNVDSKFIEFPELCPWFFSYKSSLLAN